MSAKVGFRNVGVHSCWFLHSRTLVAGEFLGAKPHASESIAQDPLNQRTAWVLLERQWRILRLALRQPFTS
jgi:hypothetical protein